MVEKQAITDYSNILTTQNVITGNTPNTTCLQIAVDIKIAHHNGYNIPFRNKIILFPTSEDEEMGKDIHQVQTA